MKIVQSALMVSSCLAVQFECRLVYLQALLGGSAVVFMQQEIVQEKKNCEYCTICFDGEQLFGCEVVLMHIKHNVIIVVHLCICRHCWEAVQLFLCRR